MTGFRNTTNTHCDRCDTMLHPAPDYLTEQNTWKLRPTKQLLPSDSFSFHTHICPRCGCPNLIRTDGVRLDHQGRPVQ